MQKIILYSFLLFLFLTKLSLATVINKIEVKGNTRITKESVIVFGNIKLNTDINDAELNLILKNLYATDFFENIDLSINNKTLIITLIENPIIQNTSILGVPSKKLREEISEIIVLKNASAFVEYYAKKDFRKIKTFLKTQGYYFVSIKSSIKENTNNTIDLVYNIKLGQKALIGKINFIGDKKIKNRKLRSIIVSEENKFWKFLSNKKYLDENRIQLDIRLLKNYYINKGYYNVLIENSSAKFLDNNTFDLNFTITAGNKFSFNEAKLILPADYNPKNFEKVNEVLKSLKNEIYSYNIIEDILDEIDQIALSQQYEFIDADVEETIINENKLNFTVIVKETEKFYVERINIYGNSITREKVIRDTLIVDEGDAFNEILHNKTINSLKAKNIFAKVLSEVSDGSTPNQKIINIEVEEKATGEISAGAGIGTTGGSVAFTVKENNYLGKGIKLDASLQLAADSLRGLVSVTNPNFNYSDRALTTTLENTSTDRLTANGYETSQTGLALSTNFEQYKDFYIAPELSAYFETLKTNSTASTALKKQKCNFFDINFNYALNLDKRNSSYQPSKGFRSLFRQELPLITDASTIKNSYEFNAHHTFVEDMVGSLSFFSSAVNSLSGDDVRISKRLFMPSRRLRGFETGKVGPRDGAEYVGGNYLTAINLSSSIPKILATQENIDFRIFFDAANIWHVDYSDTIDNSNKIRSSTGIGIDWFTPVGPLNFSLSQAITKAATDVTETFRFNLGTTF
jgi:outer membrane protein insertion porin family